MDLKERCPASAQTVQGANNLFSRSVICFCWYSHPLTTKPWGNIGSRVNWSALLPLHTDRGPYEREEFSLTYCCNSSSRPFFRNPKSCSSRSFTVADSNCNFKLSYLNSKESFMSVICLVNVSFVDFDSCCNCANSFSSVTILLSFVFPSLCLRETDDARCITSQKGGIVDLTTHMDLYVTFPRRKNIQEGQKEVLRRIAATLNSLLDPITDYDEKGDAQFVSQKRERERDREREKAMTYLMFFHWWNIIQFSLISFT